MSPSNVNGMAPKTCSIRSLPSGASQTVVVWGDVVVVVVVVVVTVVVLAESPMDTSRTGLIPRGDGAGSGLCLTASLVDVD